jgi:hypothetical protein
LKVPADVLHSLLERAPLFIRHGVTTEADMRGFLQKSFAETCSTVLGRSGYLLAISLAATYVGAHVPLPATGLPIGGTVMGTTMNTLALREGLEEHYIHPVKTDQLPESVQKRYESYRADLMPAGIRPEVNRQLVRALVTVGPAISAMCNDRSMNQHQVVLNDAYADGVTFALAEPLDEMLAHLGSNLKDVFAKIVRGGAALKQKGLEVPSHAELIAHQPLDVLEARLENYNKSWLESGRDASVAMGKGVKTLWTEKFGRMLGVPTHAACLIAVALVLTAHLIGQDEENAKLPAGEITPRSAPAVPAGLIIMEFFATEAFGTLIGICDALASRRPVQFQAAQDPIGFVEEITDDETVSNAPSEAGGSVWSESQGAVPVITEPDAVAQGSAARRSRP